MAKLMKRTLLWGPPSFVALVLVGWLIQPWPVLLRWRDPDNTSFMKYRVKEARKAGETLEIQQEWVPLSDISNSMQRAVILAEDGRFRDHDGVDWEAIGEEVEYEGDPPFSWFDPGDIAAIGRAMRYYANNRDEVRGRSTITQQLAKNLYFTPERSLTRKVSELVVAKRLEWFLSKDRILEVYLNTVELGPGIFGVEAAAQHYFDKSASNLTNYQAASLAGTLPHPLTSNPSHRPGRMAWRRDIIMGRLTGGSTDLTPVPALPEPPAPTLAADSTAVPTGDPASGDTTGGGGVPVIPEPEPRVPGTPTIPGAPPVPSGSPSAPPVPPPGAPGAPPVPPPGAPVPPPPPDTTRVGFGG
jgi:monofunctional biosynthetic peptidoglycan transglycosylase